MDNTITLYTCAWGNYWEKYGGKWIEQVKNLNTQPDEVFIVSDKPLNNCPYKVYICEVKEPSTISHFRKKAIDLTTTTWCTFSDLDDKMFPNYLDDLSPEYDVIAFSLKYFDVNEKDLNKDWITTDPKYKKIWDEYPINFGPQLMAYPNISPIKTKILKNLKITKYGWKDVNLFYQLRKLNVKIKTDPTLRYAIIETPNSLSRGKDIELKRKQTYYFREYLFENQKSPLHIKYSESL